MPNVIRPQLKTRMLGSPSCAYKGDSIGFPFTTNRLLASIKKRWPKNYGGETAFFLNNGDSGQPLSGAVSVPANASLSLGVAGGIRPGDAFPDATAGHNITRIACMNFSGNAGGEFGTYWQVQSYPNNSYNVNWELNQNLRVRALARAKTLSPNNWNLRGRARSSGTQTDGSFEYLRLQNNAPNDFYTTPWSSFARGTGANGIQIAVINSWSETEVAGWALEILAIQLELAIQANTIRWMYFGEGGFTTKMHTSAGETANIGGFGNVLFRYSDAANSAHIALGEVDTFFYLLGQNAASGESGPSLAANYEANMRSIVLRDKLATEAQGRVYMAVFLSMYPTASDASRFITMSQVLENLARELPYANHVDVCSHILATQGGWGTYSAALTTDGIHPNKAMSDLIADYTWQSMMSPNVGVGGLVTSMSTGAGTSLIDFDLIN